MYTVPSAAASKMAMSIGKQGWENSVLKLKSFSFQISMTLSWFYQEWLQSHLLDCLSQPWNEHLKEAENNGSRDSLLSCLPCGSVYQPCCTPLGKNITTTQTRWCSAGIFHCNWFKPLLNMFIRLDSTGYFLYWPQGKLTQAPKKTMQITDDKMRATIQVKCKQNRL